MGGGMLIGDIDDDTGQLCDVFRGIAFDFGLRMNPVGKRRIRNCSVDGVEIIPVRDRGLQGGLHMRKIIGMDALEQMRKGHAGLGFLAGDVVQIGCYAVRHHVHTCDVELEDTDRSGPLHGQRRALLERGDAATSHFVKGAVAENLDKAADGTAVRGRPTFVFVRQQRHHQTAGPKARTVLAHVPAFVIRTAVLPGDAHLDLRTILGNIFRRKEYIA